MNVFLLNQPHLANCVKLLQSRFIKLRFLVFNSDCLMEMSLTMTSQSTPGLEYDNHDTVITSCCYQRLPIDMNIFAEIGP